MNWLIMLIICGLLIIPSVSCTIRFGSHHFRMRDFWVFLLSFALGVASIFYLPLYVACIWWLITNAAIWTPVVRAYKTRNDKKSSASPELHEVIQPMGKIIPFSTDSDDDSPGAAWFLPLMKGLIMEEFLTLLRFWLKVEAQFDDQISTNVQVKYGRHNFGAGIIFDAFSLDNGQTWYLYHEGNIILEDDLILGMHIHNYLGCTAVGLSWVPRHFFY